MGVFWNSRFSFFVEMGRWNFSKDHGPLLLDPEDRKRSDRCFNAANKQSVK